MKKLLFIILTLNFLIMGCSPQDHEITKAIEEIDSLLTATYPENIPGAAFLLMIEDSIELAKGYGIANMDDMTPITENTFFNIASVSKQFSAVALFILAQEGKLSLDDTVSKWFPEFESQLMNKITLRHLLSHSSGIPDARDRSDRQFVTTAIDTESYEYISRLKSLNFEPGSSYEYINPTYQLMYTIIERASGLSFDEFMRKMIFDKAGMEDAIYFEAERDIPRMSHGYLYSKSSGKFEEYDYGEESFFATKADGGLYTSVIEFSKWEKAIRTDSLVDTTYLREAFTPQIEVKEIPFTHYGYGWFIEDIPGYPRKIYHTGDNGGFQIYAGRYPESQILYLIFANRNNEDREKIAHKIDSILKKRELI
jgi:CubicO group peptidase (beta-lactamase class C family)